MKRTRDIGRVIPVTIGLVLLLTIFQMINSSFLGERNISNLLRQIAPFLMVGIGQSYVLITGNIDLSVGSLVGMSGMVTATLIIKGVNPWLAALVAMIACLAFGLINGALVANGKLPSYIATLGTMAIARGIAQLLDGGRSTASIEEAQNLSGASAEAFRTQIQAFRNFFFYHKIWLFYSTVIIVLVLWAVFYFILSATKIGQHIYAVGSDAEGAKLSGISVSKSIINAYLISAFCAGIVGIITVCATGQGNIAAGQNYALYAVAVSVIGGISALGGRGTLLGTLVGACFCASLVNGLSLFHLSIALQNLIFGIIVMLSVLSDILIRHRKR